MPAPIPRLALVAAALAAPVLADAQRRPQGRPLAPTAQRLLACLPSTYAGFRRLPMQGAGAPDSFVAVAFLRDGAAININVSVPRDLRFTRAQYRLLGTTRSEVAAGGGLHLRGLTVGGVAAQRTWFPNTRKSEVGMIVGERVHLTVNLQPADGEDAVVPYAEAIDLACLARAARGR